MNIKENSSHRIGLDVGDENGDLWTPEEYKIFLNEIAKQIAHLQEILKDVES